MKNKKSLFYLANLGPEIARMFSFMKGGKEAYSISSKNNAIAIIDKVLDLEKSEGANYELSKLKTLIIEEQEKKDFTFESQLVRYCVPFGEQFVNSI